ncbi:hypothetical protein H101_02982 [Trichophyton interdigitale H6]|nr:hypothetical protein H101_02982 [Trichophyton interdigitale H6]
MLLRLKSGDQRNIGSADLASMAQGNLGTSAFSLEGRMTGSDSIERFGELARVMAKAAMACKGMSSNNQLTGYSAMGYLGSFDRDGGRMRLLAESQMDDSMSQLGQRRKEGSAEELDGPLFH